MSCQEVGVSRGLPTMLRKVTEMSCQEVALARGLPTMLRKIEEMFKPTID